MAVTFANRARMSTATTGTGTITLGTASTGYMSFAEAGITNGQTISYAIEDGNNFEVGRGVYSSAGAMMTRSVIASKINGQAADTTPISLSGSAIVFLTAAAGDLLSRLAVVADDAIVRGDGGVGGVQSSGVTIDDSNNVSGIVNLAQTGYHDLTEIATPATPAANVARVFAVDDGAGITRLRMKDSSGNVSIVSAEDVVVFTGIGNDSADDGPALQTALDSANGRTVRLIPGRTYRIATAVSTTGKSWTIDARGAKVHFDANVNGLSAIADSDNLQNVSAISGADVTVANGAAFSVGDYVRVISEDLPVFARTVVSGDTFKSGEPCIVRSIAGNVLTMRSSLVYGAAMSTNRRIFRMPVKETIEIIGGEWYYTDGNDATPWAVNMVQMFGIINPVFRGMRCTRAYGSTLLLVGTQNAKVYGHHAENCTDNTGLGQFGYGITDMGYGPEIFGLSGGKVRHLITTGALPPPALTTNKTRLHWYGGSKGLRLIGGHCIGASSAAFDTHHFTEDVVFSGLYVENSADGVSIRSNNTRVTDIEARGVTRAVYVFTEFYSPGVSDGIATEAGWCSNVHIDKVHSPGCSQAVFVDRCINLHIGRIFASCSSWRAMEFKDAQAFLHEDINLTIADTTSTHAGRGAIDSDIVTAAGFTPQVEQYNGLIRVSGSGSSGSTTFAVAKSDASIVTLRNVEAVLPNGSLGPLLITANSGTLACDLGFDVNGSGESGVTLTSGTSITANVQSNDGSKDQLDMRDFARAPAKWVSTNIRQTTTISSDTITATGSFMVVDTEASAASDNLATINGGIQGDILVIRSTDNTRDIVVKHGTGNIFLDGGADKTLDNILDYLVLFNANGTTWAQLSHSAVSTVGTVTQATSKTTGVTLNAMRGQITMESGTAIGAGANANFTLTNSFIGTTDVVVTNIDSGGTANAYTAQVVAVGAGSCAIKVTNTTGGSLSEAPVINFAVIKTTT